MDRNDSQRTFSNRTASRRMHRRLVNFSTYPCPVSPAAIESTPSALLSLPRDLVREAGMFELLAAEMRIAELEKALAEANAAAITDPLTGALNRRGFDREYQRELARSRRSGGSFVLAHIDLDDFKRLNDHYGHLVGDKALVHLVDSLQKSMRPTDTLCRFGGEEFVLMLPDATLENAAAAVSRFLSDFSARPVPGVGKAMTFSAGVVLHGPDESIEEVIQRADVATYEAKRAGKNCVVTR